MPTRKIADLPKPSTWTMPKAGRPKCSHPEHNPPDRVSLPPGIYEHECPACGHKTIFTVPVVTWTGNPYDGSTLRC